MRKRCGFEVHWTMPLFATNNSLTANVKWMFFFRLSRSFLNLKCALCVLWSEWNAYLEDPITEKCHAHTPHKMNAKTFDRSICALSAQMLHRDIWNQIQHWNQICTVASRSTAVHCTVAWDEVTKNTISNYLNNNYKSVYWFRLNSTFFNK